MAPVDTDGIERVASEFFSAIERADLAAVRELYAPDVEVWHNVTGRSQDRDQNLGLLRAWTARVGDMRYEVEARELFPGGFVQRHVVHGVLRSGQKLALPVCLVVHVEDGRITRLYEYLDGAAVAPAFADA